MDGTETRHLFEANHNDTYDGSCLVDLRKKIIEYRDGHTDIAWRALPKSTLTPEIREKFDVAVLDTFSSVPFDHDMTRGAKAILDCCTGCEHDYDNETYHGKTEIHAM